MRYDISKLEIRQSWLLDILYIFFRSSKWKEPSLLPMLRFISISFFLNDLIIMKFVLPKLIDNLLTSHDFFNFD